MRLLLSAPLEHPPEAQQGAVTLLTNTPKQQNHTLNMTEDKLQNIVNRLRRARISGAEMAFGDYKTLLLKTGHTCAETGDDEPFGPLVNLLTAQLLYALLAAYDPKTTPPLPPALEYFTQSILRTYDYSSGGAERWSAWGDDDNLDLTAIHKVHCAVCGRQHHKHDLSEHILCTEIGGLFVQTIVVPILGTPPEHTPPDLFDEVREVWTMFLEANKAYPRRQLTSREKHQWS